MRTHSVDKLLEQHCYKSAAGLLQLVRFYVRIHKTTYPEILTGAMEELSSNLLNRFADVPKPKHRVKF